MKDVIRICNLRVRFLKFTLNIKKYDEFVGFFSKLVWREILFVLKLLYLHALSPTKGWYYIGWQNHPIPIYPLKPTYLNKTQTHPIINWVKWVLTQLNSIYTNVNWVLTRYSIYTNVNWVLTRYSIKPKYHFYKLANSKILQNH